MSVYVGIDARRKRSQAAVVTGDGQVQLNRNVVNGREQILKLIGGHAGGVRGCLRLGLAGRAARGLRVRPAPAAPQRSELPARDRRQRPRRLAGPTAAPATGSVPRPTPVRRTYGPRTWPGQATS